MWGMFFWLSFSFLRCQRFNPNLHLFSLLLVSFQRYSFNALGSNVVNGMREESSIPSHSFQDLLISAEESLQGNQQAESCQAPPLRDTPPRHGIVWTSTFGIKIKTAGNPCRQQKILCGHCGPLSEFVLIVWSDHSSYTNLFSCPPHLEWELEWAWF